MYPLGVDTSLINPFSDLGKEKQNPFLDTKIRIWIFPKKRTLSFHAAEKVIYVWSGIWPGKCQITTSLLKNGGYFLKNFGS